MMLSTLYQGSGTLPVSSLTQGVTLGSIMPVPLADSPQIVGAPLPQPTYNGLPIALPVNTSSLARIDDTRPVSTPFGQMATEKRSTLDKIADTASSILGAFGIRISASGDGVRVSQDAQYIPGSTLYNNRQPDNTLLIMLGLGIVALVVLKD